MTQIKQQRYRTRSITITQSAPKHSMKFFSNPGNQRNTAFAVLLVWLFALASGVANACLLSVPETHPLVTTAALTNTTNTVLASVELAGHLKANAGHDDDSNIAKAPCLRVCDDGSQSLPKAHAAVDQTDPGPGPLIAILWTASAPVVESARRLDDLQIPIAEPPLRVRYSRLAL